MEYNNNDEIKELLKQTDFTLSLNPSKKQADLINECISKLKECKHYEKIAFLTNQQIPFNIIEKLNKDNVKVINYHLMNN